ncbi:hypothetical protein [Agrobacterium larrymoorei]|uniref:hypothetical protein n=1 Tax=Agrobacterium larrymoorei TaxID=160699 RepID=UPI003CC92037
MGRASTPYYAERYGASWATNSVLPNNFNREVRRRLEELDIPVYHSEGLDKVNVANKRIVSVRTKEGRMINADYWHDGSYSILLAVRAGCSYIMGREAAGTGKEANNGWQGLSGAYSDARFQPSQP